MQKLCFHSNFKKKSTKMNLNVKIFRQLLLKSLHNINTNRDRILEKIAGTSKQERFLSFVERRQRRQRPRSRCRIAAAAQHFSSYASLGKIQPSIATRWSQEGERGEPSQKKKNYIFSQYREEQMIREEGIFLCKARLG